MLEHAHSYVREYVSFAAEDRIFADDINKVAGLIKDFSFVKQLNEFAGSTTQLNKGFTNFEL